MWCASTDGNAVVKVLQERRSYLVDEIVRLPGRNVNGCITREEGGRLTPGRKAQPA